MQKFIIWGYPRSGTTLMVDAMNDHPNCCCYQEAWNKKYGMFERIQDTEPGKAVQVIQNWYNNKQGQGFGAAGMKLLVTNATEGAFVSQQVALLYKQNPGTKFIFLKRQDMKALLASWMVAYNTNVWHVKSPHISEIKKPLDDTRYPINRGLLSKMVDWLEYGEKRLKPIWDTIPEASILKISFEDLNEKFTNTVNRCYSFVGLKPYNIQPSMPKVRGQAWDANLQDSHLITELLESRGYEV